MYNVIMYLMQVGIAIASLFNEKVRKMWRGEREAFQILKEKVDPEAKYAWFHAASLGEFEQGRPIMERLRQEHPEYKILLTFFSPSGYEVRKNYEGADIICYMPIDTVTNARRFLRLVRPTMAFFIKYEFWYNFLHILKHRGVPTYSVSSIFRPNQVFFRWYGRQYSRVLKCFTRFFVQNEESRRLLGSIGIGNVEITGDTRFDRVLQIKAQAKVLPVLEVFLGVSGEKHARCFVAGSSWEPDEDIFFPYFAHHREWKLVVAPHVISAEHISRIEKQVEALGMVCKTLSHVNALIDSYHGDIHRAVDDANVIVIDCFGLLSSIYRYADVAYVGGGFGVGIHNLPEAAVWSVPVFFGPNNQRFQEAQELKRNGGGIEISNYDDFADGMDRFAADARYLHDCGTAAGRYVQSRAGATDKILSAVFA